MVRWIQKGEKTWDYDFKVFDKYLDVYEQKLGKPKVLMIDVCVSIHSSARPKDGVNPIKVSRLDPATGKVEPMRQPPYGPQEMPVRARVILRPHGVALLPGLGAVASETEAKAARAGPVH